LFDFSIDLFDFFELGVTVTVDAGTRHEHLTHAETMEPKDPRQGRIAGWLKMSGASVKDLAAHLGLSPAQTSRHCNAEEVPVAVLEGMRNYRAPGGQRIPESYLPAGRDKKPGPPKGWLQQRIEQARAEAGG